MYSVSAKDSTAIILKLGNQTTYSYHLLPVCIVPWLSWAVDTYFKAPVSI
jgi:hypothetical protein